MHSALLCICTQRATPQGDEMSAAAAAWTLTATPGFTLQGLIDFASFMDCKAEDEFWAEVRRLHPTLFPHWEPPGPPRRGAHPPPPPPPSPRSPAAPPWP